MAESAFPPRMITGNKTVKQGKLTVKEKAFIKANSGNLTIAQMAKKLERNPTLIENYLNDTGKTGIFTSEVLNNLRAGHEYELLKGELTDKEIKIFEKKYSEWVGQFKDDIVPSERNQIFHIIKIDMIMGKLMRRNKDLEERIAETEKDIKSTLENETLSDEERNNKLARFREYRGDSYGYINANMAIYEKQQKLYIEMSDELKANRKQRVTKEEGNKNTFLGLMRQMKDDNQRIRMGEDAELEKLAAETEADRYSMTVRYLDDSLDTPFTSGKVQ